MTLATDGQLSLAAILAAPEDDAPRLAYADWLDENGQHERAEFVRCQIELANFPRCPRSHFPDEHTAGQCVKCQEKCHPLRRRERELWFANASTSWFAGVPLSTFRYEGQNAGHVLPLGIVRRGFVAEVRCTLAAFMGGPCERCRSAGWDGAPDCPDCKGTGDVPGIAAELFARQPVTSVKLTDVEVWEMADGGWTAGSGNVHPAIDNGLFFLFCDADNGWPFPDRNSAEDGLSAACVRYGRQLAGLT